MTYKQINLQEKMLPAPRQGGFKMEGFWIWCASVIRSDEDGKYYMFSVRWPKTHAMHPSWLLNSEIVRASSDKPEGPYQFEEVILGERGAEYWDGRSVFNPKIKKIGDTYVLYYVGTTHPFKSVKDDETLTEEDPRVIVARSNKRIGIATAKSLTGPWTRQDSPILLPRPNSFDNFFTSNPAPYVEEDNSILLVYKTRTYKKPPYTGTLHGSMQIGVARAQNYHGPYQQISDTPVFNRDIISIEDPFVWKENSLYHMIAKDMRGDVCGQKHGGMHAVSEDGIHWEAIKGELAYSRLILWDDGKQELMGSLERPFLLFENGKPTYAFFGTSNGTQGFIDATDTWTVCIPLKQD